MSQKKNNDLKKNTELKDEDIVFESENIENNYFDKIIKIKKDLKNCLKENKEYLDGWQRSKADFINLKKEKEKQLEKINVFAKENILIDFLPVLDSFDMAFSNQEEWNKVDKNWRNGVEYIYSQFNNVLNKNGLLTIGVKIYDKFDPEYHSPIETIETNKKNEDDLILEIIQRGYTLNNRVLRTVKVKVGKFKK